jgi:hypothetical protein
MSSKWFRDQLTAELVKTRWEGVRNGLEIAHTMCQAVQVEALTHRAQFEESEPGYIASDAQLNVLRGLMAALLDAAHEVETKHGVPHEF